MSSIRLLAVAVSLGLVAIGCSSDPEESATAVPTVTASPAAQPTPTPTPTPSVPAPSASPSPAASPLAAPPSVDSPAGSSAAVLTEQLAGLEHPKSGGSCPVGEIGGSTIVDCAAVEAPGGAVAVIVEELPDTRHIATMLRLDEDDDLWLPVAFSEHYGFTVPDSPWVSISLRPVQNLFSGDVIVVEGLIGGSGAVTAWDIVGWPAGDGLPRVIAPFPAVGQASLVVAGGAARLDVANFSDGAPQCCPELHDLRIVNLATGEGRRWEELPSDQAAPIVAAFELYHHWIRDDEASAAEWATNGVIDELWPAPVFDVHQLLDTQCVPTPEHFRCSFQNEGGTRHFLVAPGGVHGYEVVGLIGLGD